MPVDIISIGHSDKFGFSHVCNSISFHKVAIRSSGKQFAVNNMPFSFEYWNTYLNIQILIVLVAFGAVDKPLAPCMLVHFLEI